MKRYDREELLGICIRSLAARGASEAQAQSLARATVTAEAEGNRAVGLAHLLDYLDALRAGRLAGDAEPVLEQPTPIITRVDACGGTQHLGVDRAFDRTVLAAREFGLAAVASRNGFTIGALSYFPRRLAEAGLAGLAFANAAPPVMPASGGRTPRFCTNPMACAIPLPDGEAVVIDQSSTETALVAVKQAADRGESIPTGWALDADGEPTTDPVAALAGMLLPFGGARGANIALMVEMMAAGLTGAEWSFESAAFNAGERPPGLGYFLLAIDPAACAGGDIRGRMADLVATLERDGAHVPGLDKGRAARDAGGICVDEQTLQAVRAAAD
jgi:(2R)-3-sulfolactate dehydrogenase (NADP+)